MRKLYSERVALIHKAREAMLSAVQIYNNPLITFKTESFIVLSIIAWTYLLHAHYRSKRIDYRYYKSVGRRRKFVRNPDGSIRYWELKEGLSKQQWHCSSFERSRASTISLIIFLLCVFPPEAWRLIAICWPTRRLSFTSILLLRLNLFTSQLPHRTGWTISYFMVLSSDQIVEHEKGHFP
jgi:Protein of unknown function (DUF3644)